MASKLLKKSEVKTRSLTLQQDSLLETCCLRLQPLSLTKEAIHCISIGIQWSLEVLSQYLGDDAKQSMRGS